MDDFGLKFVAFVDSQEAMHSQGDIPPRAEEEGGGDPQDLLSYEGYLVLASRPFGREV